MSVNVAIGNTNNVPEMCRIARTSASILAFTILTWISFEFAILSGVACN